MACIDCDSIIYHTETQEDFNALMIELEGKGYVWVSGRKPTESKDWVDHKENTCVVIKKKMSRACIGVLKLEYPNIPITKYKTKADEKMKFTKENIEGLVTKYFDDNVGECPGNLITEICAMDDTPEKVVVPKFAADYLEDCKKRNIKLVSALCPFKMGYGKEIELWFDNEDNNRLFALAWINGYEVEKEPLYYIPLPHLETSDGIQQVLSKRENDTHYLAWRPFDKFKQRFTKEELEQVPEIYKPYAKPIEEEEK